MLKIGVAVSQESDERLEGATGDVKKSSYGHQVSVQELLDSEYQHFQTMNK
jgi:hypothetical protein